MPDPEKNDFRHPLFEDTTQLVINEFVDILRTGPEILTEDNARVAVLGSGGRVVGVFISIDEFAFLERSRAAQTPQPKPGKFMALTCPVKAGGFPDEGVFTVPIPDEVPYSGVTDRRYIRSLDGDYLPLSKNSPVVGRILVRILDERPDLLHIHLPDRTTAWLRRSEIELHEPFPGWSDEATT